MERKGRFENVPKLNSAQMGVLLTLKDGRARVSNKTVLGPWDARRVGQATWTFIYGDLRRFEMVKHVREGDDYLAELTTEGYAYLEWYNTPKLAEAPSTIWCPICGKFGCQTMRSGCSLCGATAEAIERLEPGPWSEWGR